MFFFSADHVRERCWR